MTQKSFFSYVSILSYFTFIANKRIYVPYSANKCLHHFYSKNFESPLLTDRELQTPQNLQNKALHYPEWRLCYFVLTNNGT
jgi:hypothetical protein